MKVSTTAHPLVVVALASTSRHRLGYRRRRSPGIRFFRGASRPSRDLSRRADPFSSPPRRSSTSPTRRRDARRNSRSTMTPSCAFAPRTFPPRARADDGRGCFHRAARAVAVRALTRDARVSALRARAGVARGIPRAAPHPSSTFSRSRPPPAVALAPVARSRSRSPRPRRPPAFARAAVDGAQCAQRGRFLFGPPPPSLPAQTPHARSLTSLPPRGSLR